MFAKRFPARGVSVPVSRNGFGSFVSQGGLSGLAIGLIQGSELLRSVVTSTKGAQQHSVKGDLNGVTDESLADRHSDVAVADAVAGPGEADRSVLVDDPQHFGTPRRLRRPTRLLRSPVHLVVIIDQVTSGVSRYDNVVGGDVKQPVCRFDRDGLSGEMAADVIAVLEDAEPSGAVNASGDSLLLRCR
jgi:hypothetical protein